MSTAPAKRPKLEPETFGSLPVAHTCVEGYSRRPTLFKPFNPLGLPGPLTGRQLFYIWIPQCLGAAVIDGAANFGIACAMYRTTEKSITMWDISHNTVAGDVAVTTFIQGILSFVIASAMVHVDMRAGTIAAFPYPWPDTQFAVKEVDNPDHARTRRGKLWRTFHQRHGLGRGLHFFSGSAVNDLFDFSGRLTKLDFAHRLFWSVWKGSVLSALYFLVLWPITIACIAPHWGGLNMSGTWAPPIIKLIYGFVLGLLMNPVVAMIALGSEDAVRDHRREVHERNNEKTLEAGAMRFSTDAEMVRRPQEARFHA